MTNVKRLCILHEHNIDVRFLRCQPGQRSASRRCLQSCVSNPIVTYDTYQAAAKTAGFAPLYLTKDAGYSCNYISLISKDTADLGFQKLGQTSTTVRVRTMPQKAAKGTNDISGVYSVTWKDQVIDGTTVSVAKTNHKKEAARPLFIYSSLRTVRCRWRRGW